MFRAVVAGLLLSVSAWILLLNARVLVRGYVLRRASGSWVPFVGGAAGALGLLVVPVPAVHAYWWVPLVIDWGSIPGTLFTILFYLWRWRAQKGA